MWPVRSEISAHKDHRVSESAKMGAICFLARVSSIASFPKVAFLIVDDGVFGSFSTQNVLVVLALLFIL